MIMIWSPFVEWFSATFDINVSVTGVLIWYLFVQLVIISSTQLNSADMFYVLLTFISGIMMAGSFYFFIADQIIPLIHNFINDPFTYWAPFVILLIFPILHLIVSISLPPAFFTFIFFYLLLPTIGITLPFYSFLHLDDFSWGNR